MPAFKDLTGQRFGRLMVEYCLPEKKNNKIVWHCRCDCGNEKNVIGSSLTKQNEPTRSCGCLQKEKTRLANQSSDLTGKTYGRLTVLRRLPESSLWECSCQCGSTVVVSTNHLNQNHTQSCGCLQKDITVQRCLNNLTGQRFGLLEVIGLDVDNSAPKRLKYICRCDCGNIHSVLAKNLSNGNTQSCGCLNISHGELKIKQLLTEYNIPFIMEKTFETCINPETGKKLRFDFWVNNSYLIEYDGKQHYNDSSSDFFEDPVELRQRDQIKNQWCKDNDILLIRIPYTKYRSLAIDDLLPKTISC